MSFWNRLSTKVCDPLRLSLPKFSNRNVYTPLEGSMKRLSLLLNSISLMLSVMFLLSLSCISVFGQAGTSTVRGTVSDPQGGVVAGATATLLNVATNTSRTATTSDNGVYSFELVAAGDYRLEVEGKGFKKAVITGVHALVSQPTSVDVRLEVGNVAETVTVTAASSDLLVNKEDATLGNTFNSKQITELPTSARNVPSLLTLQPAVTKEGYVAGARADQSNITLDGVDINESQTNSVGTLQDDAINSNLPTNNTVLRLNSEAIQEFRVTTTNPTAAQGHSAGAQITVIQRSGSNQWTGRLFEFYRSKGLAANNFFNNRVGVAKPQLIRHSFGGAAGGPIVKDKIFFFYSYEARRQLSQTSVVRTVPLASLGRGELRYRDSAGGITTINTTQLNTIFPAVGMNPTAIAALAAAAAKYPANDFTVGDSSSNVLLNVAGFRFNAPTPVQLNSHYGNFSFKLGPKQELFVRTNIIYDLTSLAPQFPDTAKPAVWSHPMGIGVGHTWTLSNTLVNSFRYGYTREAFTQQGDSAANAISFRFVFSPNTFSRTLARTTPVQNFVDDLSWIRGNHTLQFGTNITLVRNQRVSFSNAFDNAIANPSFYSGGAGASLSSPVQNFAIANAIPGISGSRAGVQNAVSALIGRFSQYTANFIFNSDGSLLTAGSPTQRNFATEEYEFYGQDSWKMTRHLTLTAGLRYSLSRPVYETKGFEMKSNIPLGDLFEMRRVGALAGRPVNTAITFDKSGPANGRAPLYNWDKNNFQPRVAIAWQPSFKGGLLGKVFGNEKSSIRGGFAVSNDQYGEQLAVSFDLNNAVGFSSNFTTSANTFCTNNVACAAPRFTAYGQAVRTLPLVVVPGRLSFPNLQPSDNSRRIESSLDSRLVAPTNYTWSLTFERSLPKGLFVQASYIGRYAKNLIATRDTMALNNLVDPKSGMDWYTAGSILENLRAAGTPVSAIAQIPYFVNLFPANLATLINNNYFGDTVLNPAYNQTQAVYAMGFEVFDNDWTDTQDALDTAIGGNLFFHPQYGALASFSSIAHSWYHAGTLSVRQRLGRTLQFDFNYTLSHSLDDASGLQTSGGYGSAFILNPLRQHDWYSESDFDIRHIVNVNAIWDMPFGRGRHYMSSTNKWVDAAIGGWRLSSIFRWNSGLPISAPYDDARWATNWNVQSYAIRIKPLQTCPSRGTGTTPPKLFCDPTAAYQSFRNARPGESGDRAPFRLPGYVVLDMGISKSFTMPWNENHKLELRIEAFNVTNTQAMGAIDGSRTGYGITIDPSQGKTPPSNWSNFTGIQGLPREIQFGFRYSF
jgi:hypothetical protein